jgi:hypothetical protein
LVQRGEPRSVIVSLYHLSDLAAFKGGRPGASGDVGIEEKSQGDKIEKSEEKDPTRVSKETDDIPGDRYYSLRGHKVTE